MLLSLFCKATEDLRGQETHPGNSDFQLGLSTPRMLAGLRVSCWEAKQRLTRPAQACAGHGIPDAMDPRDPAGSRRQEATLGSLRKMHTWKKPCMEFNISWIEINVSFPQIFKVPGPASEELGTLLDMEINNRQSACSLAAATMVADSNTTVTERGQC